jgi:hypothetical protein
LKLNGVHQLLVCTDDVNILRGSVHTTKKNREALVVSSKEIGLEVNVDKTKYMVMHRDQRAGRNHSLKTDNSSFEKVEVFKYLGKILTSQNSIQEEIKSRLKSQNACCHSMQNCWYYSLLGKDAKINIHRTIIFPVFLWVRNLVFHIEGGT